MKNRQSIIIIVVLFIAFGAYRFFSNQNISIESTIDDNGNYLVDPIFQSFYEEIGGDSLCGNPLSGKYLGGYGYEEQITVNCLFYFNKDTKTIRLAPLGILLNRNSRSSQFQSIPLHPDLAKIYYGEITEEVAGSPISPPEFDADKNLWVQNFENLSIAIQPGSSSFQLLNLGQQYCEKKGCDSPLVNNLMTAPPKSIYEFLDRYPMFGSDILDEYTNEFGVKEYILNGVVLYINNNKVKLKSLPFEIGIKPAVLEKQISNDVFKEKLFSFFYVEDSLGYNIPVPILNYINQHLGGTQVSGPPISGNYEIGNNITEVCFTAYCLQYNIDEGIFRLANLGVTYYDKVFNSETVSAIEESEAYENLKIIITSDQIILKDQDQPATIHALIFYNNAPLVGIVPNLRVSSSDSYDEYEMPKTDENGETFYQVNGESLPNENGLVKISVCVLLENENAPKCLDGKNLQLTINP